MFFGMRLRVYCKALTKLNASQDSPFNGEVSLDSDVPRYSVVCPSCSLGESPPHLQNIEENEHIHAACWKLMRFTIHFHMRPFKDRNSG